MNLSDDYFLYLEENSKFINKIRLIECDKEKLIIRRITENFKGFRLPNLNSLRIIGRNVDIHYYLKILFSCDNICSLIKILDISDTELTDNGLLRLKKNIDKIKNIRIINISNTLLTSKSMKYIEFFKNKNINLLIDIEKLIPNKKYHRIFLGGSTISGKTSYRNCCSCGYFYQTLSTTIGFNFEYINPSFNDNLKIQLYDMLRWNGRFDSLIPNYLKSADGVLLLFDISSRKDFEGLNHCLGLITDYFELDDFPVLLIANKIDLERVISTEEIEKFQKDNELIGFFEVSCKKMINVKESFDFLVDYIIKKEKEDYNRK